ncbi:MAG: energy transducer TonB [Alistipes sp.]|nr:energy transducer TonB [Alistipes sp.]
MKRPLLLLLLVAAFRVAAQQPLYLVNGTEYTPEAAAALSPADIERIEELPADEESIARYGERASDGVILITLRFDTPARFDVDSLSFDAYIARQVKWNSDEPAARVVLRYAVTPEGATEVTQELESTDSRLKRRVLKVVAEAPRWTPATKNGEPVASEGVLTIHLPEGKPLRREPYIRLR